MRKVTILAFLAALILLAPSVGHVTELDKATTASQKMIDDGLGGEGGLAGQMGAYSDIAIVTRGDRHYRAKEMLDKLPELAPLESVAAPRDREPAEQAE